MGNRKAGAAIGVGILGTLGALIVRARGAAAEQPSGLAASVVLAIRDARTGELVPRNSPAEVEEGGSYIASFTVTNLTKRSGVNVPASLMIVIDGQAGSFAITFLGAWTVSFGAGLSLSYDMPFTVPDLGGGGTGVIQVRVLSPDGNTLVKSVTEALTILGALVYDADISPIGVA